MQKVKINIANIELMRRDLQKAKSKHKEEIYQKNLSLKARQRLLKQHVMLWEKKVKKCGVVCFEWDNFHLCYKFIGLHGSV
jgi:hypothetical protein